MLKRHRKINASLKAFRRITTSKEVTVLGDGAIRVCAALYLQRDGFEVTLIDRDEPASDCSFGNAGLIQCASVVTVATPGIVRQVPRMLLDKSQPLFIQRRYLPSLSPYILRFLGEARDLRRGECLGAGQHRARLLRSLPPADSNGGNRGDGQAERRTARL